MNKVISIPLDTLPLGKENSTTSLLLKISKLLDEYMLIIERNDYNKLNSFKFQLYGMADEVFNRIILLSYFSNINRSSLDGLDRNLSRAFKEISKDISPKGEELKKNILKELNRNLTNTEAEERFESLMDGSHPVFDTAISQSKLIDSQLNIFSNQYVILTVFAEQADYFSHLKIGLATDLKDKSSIKKVDIELVTSLKLQLDGILEKGYKDIYKCLKHDKLAIELLELAKKNQDMLQGFFGIAGSLLGAFLSKIPNGNDMDIKILSYRAAVNLTETVKKALTFFSYMAYIKSNLSERSTNRWLSNEKRRTDKREFSSMIPMGKTLTIESLIIDNNIKDGTLVQIEGLVTSIQIRDDQKPPKFSTFLVLADIRNNSEIILRAHMFGLEDNGISIGSYLRINGFVRRNVHWLQENQIGLDIDRINLTELARNNWLDDVIKRMKDYYVLYKDGMNMFFTLN